MYSECQRSCVHSKIKNNVPQYQRKCQRLTKFNTLYVQKKRDARKNYEMIGLSEGSQNLWSERNA